MSNMFDRNNTVQPKVKEELTEKLGLKEPEIVEKPAQEDLLAELKEKKPKSGSYSLFLDDEVVDALDKLAKQNKSSRSKVANTLFRNLLLK